MHHNANPGDDGVAAAAESGRPLQLPGWGGGPLVAHDQTVRADAERRAVETDAARQLLRCFPRWTRALEHLRLAALDRLAANQPVEPNDPDTWCSSDEHAEAVLRRHGLARTRAGRLQLSAVHALIDGQAHADRQAGLDWTTVTVPPSRLDEALRRAHARLPIDLDDPRMWVSRDDQRRALGHRLGVGDDQADDLSRWALAHPDAFDADDLRCWRIASPTWLALADQQLEPIERVERPVAMFVIPAARGDGWQLVPVLSLDATVRKGKPSGVWVTHAKMRQAEKQLAAQAQASYERTVRDWQAGKAKKAGASVTAERA